jgi:5-histidylcysteine sulfoxide synthase/putative 4-mercaptohistidine N1-methyltranferase
MLHITQNISLYGNDIEQKRKEIKEYFNKTYESYEALFECMDSDKSYYVRADYLRHPLIFYYGHTACFYINKLVLAKRIKERINPHFESIFAVGVDEMSWDDLDEKNYDWPSVAATKNYRDAVKEMINGLIDTTELSLPITWDSPFWAILMGIEHERIHLETSSVLMRQLPIEYVKNSAQFPICPNDNKPPQNTLVDVKGARVKLGKKFDDDYYGWDNEYGTHEAQIPDFQAAKYLVSNGEFLEFVNEGGYEKDSYWQEEGLQWRNYVKAKHPTFWIERNGDYLLRTMTQIIPLPLSWPVEVNYHEAKAFCNYKSKKEGLNLRLPTEDEWYRLVDFTNAATSSKIETKTANINLEHYASSVPVNTFGFGEFYDVIGNVWQWTQTPIYPFDGFKVHPLYDDFTMPTYDGKHNLIKGGSWISTGNEALLTSRYAFRRHFFQHAGFRYVCSNYEETIKANVYESDASVAMYANMSWGKEHFGVPNFKKRCAQIALEFTKNRGRALDIGCALGRGTFELARVFDKVVGVDYTARFIQNAQKMKEDKKLSFWTKSEGELKRFHQANLSDFDLENYTDKTEFWQGDACNLKPVFSGYDLVFATNLIDRLYDPKKFLTDIGHRINSEGVLFIASPYSWDEAYTPRQNWLGGFKKDGENYMSFDAIEAILRENFSLLHTQEVEFVIQESDRKFQHSFSEVSVWQKC